MGERGPSGVLGTIGCCLIGVVAAVSPAAAAPVAVEEQGPAVNSSSVRLSSVGLALLPVRNGYLVVSEADLGLRAVTFVSDPPDDRTVPGDGAGADGVTGAGNDTDETETDGAEVIVLGAVAAQGNRMVAVDSAGAAAVASGKVEDALAPVVRIFRTPTAPEESFVETDVVTLPEEIASTVRRFGTSIAIGGDAIAVVSETIGRSDRVDIFRITAAGTAQWFQELRPETLDTSVAVSTSGATIAVSGVNRLAASGELLVHQIGPSGWVPTQRFLRIGGGPLQIDGDQIFVQRNSFFARASGPWSVVTSRPGRPFEVSAELPVEGDSIAVGTSPDADARVIVVGDSSNDLVYLLQDTPTGARFSQALRAPRSESGREPARFGAAVLITGEGRLLVGAPGPGAQAPEGNVHAFSLTDGPIGCTVIGTEQADRMRPPPSTAGEVLCGLGGDDVLISRSGNDVVYGGPGDDDLTGSALGGILDGGVGSDDCRQTQPVQQIAEILNCEG